MNTRTRFLLFASAMLFWPGGTLTPAGNITSTITPWTVGAGIACFGLAFLMPWKNPAGWQRWAPAGLLAMAILKTLALLAYHPPGLLASYYANPDFQPPHETSWRYRALADSATRIDPSLDFYPDGFRLDGKAFPLYFVNDFHRFNRIGDEVFEQLRRAFPFSVTWSGTLAVPAGVTHLQLQASGGAATVRIGQQVLQATNNSDTITTQQQGTVSIAGEFHRAGNDAPRLALRWSRDGSHFATIPPAAFAAMPGYTGGNRPWVALYWATCGGWAGILLVLLVRAIDWSRMRQTPREPWLLLALFSLLATASLAQLIIKGEAPDAQVFSAGNDWMRYETMAQSILMGDWLNAAYTEGTPFFMNVMYRYWMAGMHALVGEDPLLVIWLQQLAMYAFVIGFYRVVSQYIGRGASLVATTLMLASGEMLKYPNVLLDTTFSIILSALMLAACMAWRQRPGTARLLAAGLLLTLAVATRANFLPFALVVAAWIAWPTTPSRVWRWKPAVFLVVMAALPVLLTGWRNHAVTGAWIWMPSSGSFNLWIGNHPPVTGQFDPFDFPPIPPATEQSRIAMDYILAEPGALLYRMAYKLAYLFGIVIWKKEIAWGVFIPTMLALFGFFAAAWPQARWRAGRLLLGLWVAANFGALCLVFPWVYGWRLSGPTLPAIGILGALALLDAKALWQARKKTPA